MFRLIYLIVLPLLLLGRVWAVLRKRESWRDFVARWRGPDVAKGTVWIHGASVGELTSAKPLIAALTDRLVLVTANTLTGRDRVAAWDMPHVTARLAPFDRGPVARRMVANCSGLIVLENELWLRRITAAYDSGVPVMFVAARMSDRSAKTWRRFATAAQLMLSQAAMIVPQDAASGHNLIALGAPADAMRDPVPLKAAYTPVTTPIPADLAEIDRSRTVLAASTHAGEEELVLLAFLHALKVRPDLRLILSPRHPERSKQVLALLRAESLDSAVRSAGHLPDGQVYLADTLGEMSVWFRLSGVAFIGGSLVKKGGHTPYEPAAYGCPILHGPHVRNFQDIYAKLDAAGGAVAVTTPKSLGQAFIDHLGDEEMARRAREVAAPADLAPLIAEIKAVLRAGSRH